MKKSNNKAAAEAITVNRRRLLNNDAPFAMKEAYVKLRTSLMFCMTADKARPCKTFAVTSAKPSEGKSLTAANIAISYAMLGKRVLLVDADMRKPTQRRLWKVELSTGLCDYLAKIWQLELAKVTELPLWIVCTGTIPPNPTELLSAPMTEKIFASLQKAFDYVIVDTPPVSLVTDAAVLCGIADGVLLVVRPGVTTIQSAQLSKKNLEAVNAHILGVVINGYNGKQSGRRDGYSYAYSYSYYDEDKKGNDA